MSFFAANAEAPDAGADEAVRAAHARLMQDPTLQHDFPEYQVEPPVAPPSWLSWLGDLINFLGPILKYVFWAGVIVGAAIILYFVGRSLLEARYPDLFRRKSPKTAVQAEPEWRPDPQRARDLLAEADALAAKGAFAEASHLLLFRSIEDINAHRPRLLRPALTSRDIGSLADIPETARNAFRSISQVVETSFFGGREVDALGFATCRKAYEAFAFPRVWAS